MVVLQETGLALKRPFARIIGEPLVTVSGVQVLQEQMCPPTPPGMEHHAASPVTTEVCLPFYLSLYYATQLSLTFP